MKCGKRMAAFCLAGLVGVATLAPAFPAWAAGWVTEGSQWKYINTDGTVQKGWAKTADGTYYYLDLSTGFMSSG